MDIVDSPESILEDFVAHDKDILVPSEWSSTGYDVAMGLIWGQIFGFTDTTLTTRGSWSTLKANVRRVRGIPGVRG